MKKITQKDISKLTPIPYPGGKTPRVPQLYNDLLEMKKGETRFMSKKEWESFGYKSKGFRCWWSSTRNNIRQGHKTRLANIKLEITSYTEGWIIKKI